MKAWIARDKNERLWLYVIDKPIKFKRYGWISMEGDCVEINANDFPQVKWSDAEPTEVEITIKKKGGAR